MFIFPVSLPLKTKKLCLLKVDVVKFDFIGCFTLELTEAVWETDAWAPTRDVAGSKTIVPVTNITCASEFAFVDNEGIDLVAPLVVPGDARPVPLVVIFVAVVFVVVGKLMPSLDL